MVRICALCWSAVGSLDRLVANARLSHEMRFNLISTRDLVRSLEYLVEVGLLSSLKGSLKEQMKEVNLVRSAVLQALVSCAPHPLLRLKLRHPSAAVRVCIPHTPL